MLVIMLFISHHKTEKRVVQQLQGINNVFARFLAIVEPHVLGLMVANK